MEVTEEKNRKAGELSFTSIYPLYLQKIEKKGRTVKELNKIIEWLTGFNESQLKKMLNEETTFKEFFENAIINPKAHLITGVIEWLHKLWIDGKILMAMDDVDRQAKTLLEEWEKDDRQSTAHIVETGVFGDEGWSLEITNPIVERRSESTSTGMAPPSDAQRLQQDEGDNSKEE